MTALLPLALLSGCGNNPSTTSSTAPPSASTTTAPPGAASATPLPTATAPPFPANTQPDTSPASGGPFGLVGATTGAQDGYDRVVFNLGGSAPGMAGWRVEYVAAPTSDGSGDPVAVTGSSYLQVVLKDVGLPGDTGIPDPATKVLTPTNLVVVKQVVLDTVFEGQYTAFIGVTATLPFRVFRLGNPERVVVDVRHS